MGKPKKNNSQIRHADIRQFFLQKSKTNSETVSHAPASMTAATVAASSLHHGTSSTTTPRQATTTTGNSETRVQRESSSSLLPSKRKADSVSLSADTSTLPSYTAYTPSTLPPSKRKAPPASSVAYSTPHTAASNPSALQRVHAAAQKWAPDTNANHNNISSVTPTPTTTRGAAVSLSSSQGQFVSGRAGTNTSTLGVFYPPAPVTTFKQAVTVQPRSATKAPSLLFPSSTPKPLAADGTEMLSPDPVRSWEGLLPNNSTLTTLAPRVLGRQSYLHSAAFLPDVNLSSDYTAPSLELSSSTIMIPTPNPSSAVGTASFPPSLGAFSTNNVPPADSTVLSPVNTTTSTTDTDRLSALVSRAGAVFRLYDEDDDDDVEAVWSQDDDMDEAEADNTAFDPANFEEVPTPSNEGQATQEIQWGGKTWLIPTPTTNDLPTCLENLQNKTRVEKIKAECESAVMQDKLDQFITIVAKFMSEMETNGWLGFDWKPINLEKNVYGVYGIKYRSDSVGFKVGQSRNCMKRVKDQGHLCAWLIAPLEHLKGVIPLSVRKAIKELELPVLAAHADHYDGSTDDIICNYLGELFFACRYSHCLTNTVAEGLIRQPSARIQAIMNPPPPPPELIERRRDKKSECIMSWPTLPSYLKNKARNGHKWYAQRLQNIPTDGDFAKEHFYMRIHGLNSGMYLGYEDAVSTPPRIYRDLDPLLVKLKPLCDEFAAMAIGKMPTDEVKMKIDDALVAIQGDNRFHYFEPTDQELADGALCLLRKKLNELPLDVEIRIEQETVKQLCKFYPQEWYDLIDVSSLIVYEDTQSFLAKSGHSIVVSRSFFRIVSEKTYRSTRFDAVRSFIAEQALQIAAGNIKPEHMAEVRHFQACLCAFLMVLEGLESPEDLDEKDNYYEGRFYVARDRMFSKEWFLAYGRFTKGLQTTFGTDTFSLLYLADELGPDSFAWLCQSQGIQTKTAPLGLDWKCGGAMALGRYPHEPCTQTSYDGDNGPVLVGALGMLHKRGLKPGNMFEGMYCCQRCHKKVIRRIDEYLLVQTNAKYAAKLEEFRKQEAETNNNNNNNNNNKAKVPRPSSFDPKAQAHAGYVRVTYKQKAAALDDDDEAYQEHRAKLLQQKKDREERAKENGTQKKQKKQIRLKRKVPNISPPYPKWFIDRLRSGAVMYGHLNGTRLVYSGHINDLFAAFLLNERETLKVPLAENGKPMYHELSYQKVKRGIFEKSARPQKYVFLQYDKETADENMKKSARIEQSEKGGLIKHVVDPMQPKKRRLHRRRMRPMKTAKILRRRRLSDLCGGYHTIPSTS